MSEPKKVDRRKFIYAGLGAVALIAIGAAAYVAMNPPVVTQTVTTSTTVPTTSVVTTTMPTTSVVTTTVPTTSVVTTTVPPTTTPEKYELKFFHWSYLEEKPKQWMDRAAERFLKANPHISNVRREGVTSTDYWDKLVRLVAAGDAPDCGGINDFKSAVSMDMIIPLDPYWSKEDMEKFYPSTYEAFIVNDLHYGLPFFPGNKTLFYNTRIMKEAGWDRPPKNRDEFIQACRDTTKDTDGDGKIDQWGYIFEVKQGRIDHGPFDHFRVAFGARFCDEKGKCIVDSPEWIELAEFIKYLYVDLKVVYPDFIRSWEVRNVFGAGKANFWIDGSWHITTMETSFPNFKDYNNALIPQMKEGITKNYYMGTSPFAIFKQSKHPKDAWGYLYYLVVDPQGQKEMVEIGGYTPTRKDWKEIGITLDPMRELFVVASEYCAPDDRWVPNYKYVGSRLDVALQEILLQRKTPKEALSDAASDINKVWGK